MGALSATNNFYSQSPQQNDSKKVPLNPKTTNYAV